MNLQGVSLEMFSQILLLLLSISTLSSFHSIVKITMDDSIEDFSLVLDPEVDEALATVFYDTFLVIHRFYNQKILQMVLISILLLISMNRYSSPFQSKSNLYSSLMKKPCPNLTHIQKNLKNRLIHWMSKFYRQ